MKKILASASILAIMIAMPVCAQTGKDAESVLQAGESCFKAMKQKDYAGIWNALSAKSKGTIVADVSKRATHTYPREQIETDFSIGGLISRSYWEEYLFYFDPDTVLEQSVWELGPIDKQQAEVILQYKKAEQPARLKMFKEQGLWKVGLIETFGTERRDKPRW
jgi:hypothetical protein